MVNSVFTESAWYEDSEERGCWLVFYFAFEKRPLTIMADVIEPTKVARLVAFEQCSSLDELYYTK